MDSVAFRRLDQTDLLIEQSTWYSEGLKFSCTQCGNCCTGEPGTVRISPDEIKALAGHLGMSERAFRGIYTRKVKGSLSLREKENYDCIFWDKAKGCTVYQHRPKQCRTWPFWEAVVSSEEMWQDESKHCPGMNQGEHHSAEFIGLTILDDGTSGYVPK